MPFLPDEPDADDGVEHPGTRNQRYPASVERIVAAQDEGRHAVHDGVSPGHSPYVGDHSEQGRFLALMWFRGYRSEQQRIAESHRSAGDRE